MQPEDIQKLRSLTTFESLVDYLRDELDWPIEAEKAEDITFEYTPEELGLSPEAAVKIRNIRQLRPLQDNQLWGIFWIDFEPKKLPVTIMRRILNRLVSKQRGAPVDRPTWQLDDLLFISAVGDEKSANRELNFAHFHQEPGDLPTLRVLGWDGSDTILKLEYVAGVLREKLRWPDDPRDANAWRVQWASAFRHKPGHVIRTADALAARLAELARGIRIAAETIMKYETEKGRLRKLHKAFQTALIHDLSEADFADTYAQTITYGLLTAAISRTDMSAGEYGTALVAENIRDMVPVTNPFLREMLETFLHAGGRRGDGIDFDELGIQDVVELLRSDETDLPAILRDFNNRAEGEDPVIRFYEDFLAAYDKALKVQRGVFYTPKPVVSYIVRGVHELLQSEFGLEDGLADTSTWAEVCARNASILTPKGVAPNSFFVTILDPATGTATFLVEVIDVIYKTMTARWKKQGKNAAQIQAAWNEYVPQALLPRLYGYELMMAPYAIAHMKIGLKLYETGYRFASDQRANIYLTNALEEPSQLAQGSAASLFEALGHESQAVNDVKRGMHFTVVIGNPPYSGVSSNKNAWIEQLLKGYEPSIGKTANYYEIDGESLGEKKLWLQDDYVKFIRFSHFLIEKSSIGIHAMITNHGFVDSPTSRGMRYQMFNFYSRINIIDLHGSSKKGEIPPENIKDENVFDIMPGVAISICCKSQIESKEVLSYDLWGSRDYKYSWLTSHGITDVGWEQVIPTHSYYLFVPRELDFESEYQKFFSLKEIFPFYGTGIQTSRDDFATDYDRKELEKRLENFFDLKYSDHDIKLSFQLSDTRGWIFSQVRRRSSFKKVQKTIQKYLFRVFDLKWIALTKDVVDWPREEAMSSVDSNHIGLLCSRQQAVPGFRHAIAVNTPVDMFCISNKSREGQTLFPLFVSEPANLFSSSSDGWRLNIGDDFASLYSKYFNKQGENNQISPSEAMAIFNYIYAILFSPAYRERYRDLLKMDYPRLPLTSNVALFRQLCGLGAALVSCHLLEAPVLDSPITQFVSGANGTTVGAFSKNKAYENGRVYLDTSLGESSSYFEGVPEEVYNFHIGGYQVLYKWLYDRRGKKGIPGRTLTPEDIEHYQKIVVALQETMRLMAEIDEVIEEHGGWPIE